MINPTDVLEELRRLFAVAEPLPMQRMRMAELFGQLDQHLCNEGHLPEDWRNAQRP